MTLHSAGAGSDIRLPDVLSALSYALDLTEGQTPGHAVRSAVIGMQLAEEAGLPSRLRAPLHYALLIKDAGRGSSHSLVFEWLEGGESLGNAHGDCVVAPESWRPLPRDVALVRARRGAAIARKIGLPEETAEAICGLDEHWDGQGLPEGRSGADIPLLSRIMSLAQTIETCHGFYGADTAVEVALRRSGSWFDPQLVRAFLSIARRGRLWEQIVRASSHCRAPHGGEDSLSASPAAIDRICLAFAEVIDAKSPFTYRHSTGVAETSVRIALALGLAPGEVASLRRAALLHDIGKLAVSNSILDKPGPLTAEEWEIVRKHPYYTLEILNRIPGFGEMAEVAASHHERLDGSGYFRKRRARDLSRAARILMVADVFDALAAKRPYRDALPLETVFRLIAQDVPRALDGECFEALRQAPAPVALPGAGWEFASLPAIPAASTW